MNCQLCGSTIQEGLLYCGECSAPADAASAPSQQPLYSGPPPVPVAQKSTKPRGFALLLVSGIATLLLGIYQLVDLTQLFSNIVMLVIEGTFYAMDGFRVFEYVSIFLLGFLLVASTVAVGVFALLYSRKHRVPNAFITLCGIAGGLALLQFTHTVWNILSHMSVSLMYFTAGQFFAIATDPLLVVCLVLAIVGAVLNRSKKQNRG